MVETPAAALLADQFARDADFFSIGTNDLTQYTLAMDRTHPRLAPALDALHPAVLRLIDQTVRGAHARQRWVGVCGSLASDPQAVPILIGLGVDELSVSVPAVPAVKAQIRRLRLSDCREVAARALAASAASEVRALVNEEDEGEVAMNIWKNAFGSLQKIGKALMLPVSVLPVAGILLGVGSAHFTWLPAIVSDVMAQSGGAIFGNLPLIFAIGVALGFTANDGVAALAAVVAYVVLLATMGVVAVPLGYEPKTIMGIPSIETGVFGGILIGAIAGWLFNRYFRLQLPPYLGFFSGKRSVPILAALAAVAAGVVLSLVWPPIGRGIDSFSRWAASGNPAAAFAIYGIVERSLIPFGLHHIWNVPFFFEVGQYPGPGQRQDPARRSLPLRRRRSHRRESRRRVPLQDVGTAGCRHRHVAQRQAREPGEGRWDHDFRGAHVLSNRHHRANRVFVSVRRAAAVRDPRGARRGGVLHLYRARHPSRHDVLARADRLRRAVPAVDTRPLVPLARPDLGCSLLRHLSDDDPAV